MLALLVYLALGGSFIAGQTVVSEIGRYELWSSKRRALLGAATGALIFTMSSTSFLFDAWTYPIAFFGLMITAKYSTRTLNSLMPDRFQPTGEELKQKYNHMFRVDSSEIEEILDSEREFIEMLDMGVNLPKKDRVKPEPQEKEGVFELGELGRAIKRFLEREDEW